MSCHKIPMITRVITVWREHVYVTLLTTSMSTMPFLIKIMFILKGIKSHLKEAYATQILTLVVISYELSVPQDQKSVNFFAQRYQSQPITATF